LKKSWRKDLRWKDYNAAGVAAGEAILNLARTGALRGSVGGVR
jgi:hypothetical protein